MQTRNRYNGRVEQTEVYEAALISAGFIEYPLNDLMNAGVGHPNNLGDRVLKATIVFLAGPGTQIKTARSLAAGNAGRYKISNSAVAAVLDFDWKDRQSSLWIDTGGVAIELNIGIEYTLKA